MKFCLPSLPYDYKALEPHYSEEMLRIHHGKHHKAYTDKLNKAVDDAGLSSSDIEYLLKNLDSIDEKFRTAIRNNGGGYYNHTFFWESLAPAGQSDIKGDLLKDIEKTFGSFESFQAEFSAAAATHFGSGWAWLVVNSEGQLQVTDTHDQISCISLGQIPLLTIDVWEHAYYLQYKNVRPDWIQNFWSIVNWDKVMERYVSAKIKKL